MLLDLILNTYSSALLECIKISWRQSQHRDHPDFSLSILWWIISARELIIFIWDNIFSSHHHLCRPVASLEFWLMPFVCSIPLYTFLVICLCPLFLYDSFFFFVVFYNSFLWIQTWDNSNWPWCFFLPVSTNTILQNNWSYL